MSRNTTRKNVDILLEIKDLSYYACVRTYMWILLWVLLLIDWSETLPAPPRKKNYKWYPTRESFPHVSH